MCTFKISLCDCAQTLKIAQMSKNLCVCAFLHIFTTKLKFLLNNLCDQTNVAHKSHNSTNFQCAT